jgi:type II secretory pathway pseudopilin PulG
MKFGIGENRQQRGYILLVLLLFMALLSIGMLTAVEGVEFQMRRDREEELIHRGVEYSRAVRKYVKQFGRYPTSIEALENSNNLRFLRKRFKDPVTKRDFKVLYYGDPETFSQNAPLVPPGTGSPQLPTAVPRPTTATPNPESLSSIAAANSQEVSTDPEGAIPSDGMRLPDPADQTQADASAQDDGGRAIVGVTSYSKLETIRVFNKKNHYNQWQFVYDPSKDVGLMKGPDQPLPKGAGQPQTLQNEQKLTSDSGMSGTQK